MFGFHRHKWGPPQDRYQSCETCGKTRVLPCLHVWKTIQEMECAYLFGGKCYIVVQQCQKCGEIKGVKVV